MLAADVGTGPDVCPCAAVPHTARLSGGGSAKCWEGGGPGAGRACGGGGACRGCSNHAPVGVAACGARIMPLSTRWWPDTCVGVSWLVTSAGRGGGAVVGAAAAWVGG